MIGVLLLWICHCTDSSDAPLVETGFNLKWTAKTAGEVVYLSSADGYIHCLNIFSGKILWSIPTGQPLFQYQQGNTIYIPSIDGYLVTFKYRYGYKRISFPIRDLAYFAPFRTEYNEIFASAKQTTLFFVDPENGTIITSYKADSQVPTFNPNAFHSHENVAIVRIDYTLNILDNVSDIIRYSDFDIVTGASNTDVNTVTITTGFNGAITIEVNGSITSTTIVPGFVAAIYGENCKFVHRLLKNGENLQASKVLIMSGITGPIAVPAQPIKPPAVFDIFIHGLPALPGRQGPPDPSEFSYGVHDVKRPFASINIFTHDSFLDYRFPTDREEYDRNSLMPPTLPSDVRPRPGIGLEENIVVSRITQFNYGGASVILLVLFALLKILDQGISWYIRSQLNHTPIIIDKTDPTRGKYGETDVTVFTVECLPEAKQSLKASRDARDLRFTSTLVADQIVDGRLVLGFQPMERFEFEGISIRDVIELMRRLLESLESIHASNLVHGGVSRDVVMADASGGALLCGLEWSCSRCDDGERRADDVYALGELIVGLLEGGVPPSKMLIYDLLDDMLDSDWMERPTPSEALSHPIFWPTTKRIRLISAFNDELSVGAFSAGQLAIFERNRIEVMQCVKWLGEVDDGLARDIIARGDYATDTLRDLVRMIRNKTEHNSEIPPEVVAQIGGGTSEAVFEYFESVFPNLLLYVYYFQLRYGKEWKWMPRY